MSVESDRSAATITALGAISKIPAPTHPVEVNINGELVVVPSGPAGTYVNVPTLVADQLIASGYITAAQKVASDSGKRVYRVNR